MFVKVVLISFILKCCALFCSNFLYLKVVFHIFTIQARKFKLYFNILFERHFSLNLHERAELIV